MAKVLVIDDDPSLLRALRLGLGAAGHDVTVASRGELGLTQAAVISPDVIVLDLGLPDIDGLTVCTRIRQWSDVPILVLSATDAEGRKVAALDAGADDYVTKPFGMAELAARIRTALRHRQPGPAEHRPTELAVGPLRLDLVHRDTTMDGHPVELTNKEFDLIAFLAQHAGKTCTHQMILVAVWGPTYAGESQYLHVYVNRLRQKLGDATGSFLVTTPGVGYGLNPPPERP
ncbi:MAG TPA: response regulator transcription factor [Acidimicrobiales bacterium]|nr:response regulator transcription factor [Acidimicrobiales bacterium]